MRSKSMFADETCGYHARLQRNKDRTQPYFDLDGDVIAQQKEHISSYARELGWEVAESYIDTDGSEAFERLKNDAISRKYDCVITDSVFRFGVNFGESREFLESVLLNVGIPFAVAEDKFCSTEKCRAEIRTYFKSLLMTYTGEARWITRQEQVKNGLLDHRSERFGLQLSDDCTRLIPIPEQAEAVQEIFRMYVDGRSLQEIVDEMNRKGYPTASRNGVWGKANVKPILSNPIYMGEGTLVTAGMEVPIKAEPIITAELFNAAQAIRGETAITIKHPAKKKEKNILLSKVHDGDTGETLSRTGVPGMYIRRGNRGQVPDEEVRRGVPYETVIKVIKEAVKNEKESAAGVLEKLDSGGFPDEKEELLKPLREKAAELTLATGDSYLSKMAGDSEEVGAEEALRREKQIETEFQKVMGKAADIEKAYSRKNPWIRTFADAAIPEELTSELIRRWIADVLVYDIGEPSQSIGIVFRHDEWKCMLPDYLFSDTRYRVIDYTDKDSEGDTDAANGADSDISTNTTEEG